MNNRSSDHHWQGRTGLRGFVAFVAVALWFLMAVLSAGRAAAQGPVMTAAELTPAIEDMLIANGAPADGEFRLDNPGQPIADPSFAHVSYNPLSGRFILRMTDGSALTGAVAQMAQYAVVNRAIERGEIISESDIAYVDAPVSSVRGYIDDADAIIGKIARRAIPANRPIRASSLETPLLVKKGAIVTLTYKVDGLRMTHQGVAQDNGGAGEVVSVKNIKSDITLKGVVADRNLVSIIPRYAAIEG